MELSHVPILDTPERRQSWVAERRRCFPRSGAPRPAAPPAPPLRAQAFVPTVDLVERIFWESKRDEMLLLHSAFSFLAENNFELPTDLSPPQSEHESSDDSSTTSSTESSSITTVSTTSTWVSSEDDASDIRNPAPLSDELSEID